MPIEVYIAGSLVLVLLLGAYGNRLFRTVDPPSKGVLSMDDQTEDGWLVHAGRPGTGVVLLFDARARLYKRVVLRDLDFATFSTNANNLANAVAMKWVPHAVAEPSDVARDPCEAECVRKCHEYGCLCHRGRCR